MKKMVLTMAVIAMLAMLGAQMARGEEAAAAEYKFPGWKCRDAAVIEAQLALAPDGHWDKPPLTYMLDFARNGEPATFADACARIEAAVAALHPTWSAERFVKVKKQYAYCCGVFQAEAIAYCKANPCSYDFYFGLKDKSEWGFQTVANCLLNYGYAPASALLGVEYLNRQAISLGREDAEVLALLKKLNRVFSAQLTKDQAAWEKVVAQVRTLMETYE